jgi:hypothetical protein
VIGAPTRCVVDTNVATTANYTNADASPDCVADSARALQAVMASGHVFIDNNGLIIAEYRSNLSAKGQPGPGDAFLKWLYTHEWGGQRVTQVTITPKADDPEDFEELPSPPKGVRYDRSDRKFLAVAASHPAHPPILQSLDSKWWGWRDALASVGVIIHFLCPDEVEDKYQAKINR